MQLFTSDCSSLTGVSTNTYGVGGVAATAVTKDSRSAWQVAVTSGTGYSGSDIAKYILKSAGVVSVTATFRTDAHANIGTVSNTNFVGEPYIDQVAYLRGTTGLGLALNWMYDGLYSFTGTDSGGSFTKISSTTNGTGSWETWKIVTDWKNQKYDVYRSLDEGTTYTQIVADGTAFKTEPSPNAGRVNFGGDVYGTVSGTSWFDNVTVDTSTTELFSTPFYNNPKITDYWRLEGTTPAKGTWNLTNNNTVTFGTSAGMFNNGADGGTANTDKSLSAATNFGIVGGSISIGGWVRCNKEIPSGAWAPFAVGGGTGNVEYHIRYNYNSGNRALDFVRDKNGAGEQISNATITLGTTEVYLLGMTYDGTSIRGYVNGTLAAGPTAASGTGPTALTAGFRILSWLDGSSFAASMGVDDVFLGNDVLTDAEWQKIYQGTYASSTGGVTYGNQKTVWGVDVSSIKKTNGVY